MPSLLARKNTISESIQTQLQLLNKKSLNSDSNTQASKMKFGAETSGYLRTEHHVNQKSYDSLTYPEVNHTNEQPRADFKFVYIYTEELEVSSFDVVAIANSYSFEYDTDILITFRKILKVLPPSSAFRKLRHSAKSKVENYDGEYESSSADISNKTFGVDDFTVRNYHLWPKFPLKPLLQARMGLAVLVKSRVFSFVLMACVVINTIILSIDHYGINKEFQDIIGKFNFSFTILFAVELTLKALALGRSAFTETMDVLDSLIVVLSILELALLPNAGSTMSAFRAIRVLRTLRVLRATRVFRYLKPMSEIMAVVSNTIAEFMYLALLMMLFSIIFALIGMGIFQGKFDFPEGRPRAHYDDFPAALISNFQLLTLENWPSLLASGMRSTAGPASALYFIVWIFLGNYILLNLFMSVLLESFSEAALISVVNQPLMNHTDSITLSKQQASLEVVRDNQLEESSLNTEQDTSLSEVNLCKKSLNLFPMTNLVRKACINLSSSRRFEAAIIAMIVLSTGKLIWETYNLDSMTDSEADASFALDLIFTLAFSVEAFVKVIALGLYQPARSYLKSPWNKLDFVIVGISILEISLTGLNLNFVKVLRVLRVGRPLRFLSSSSSMKLVFKAIIESITAIANVLVVVLLIWLIFAILGVSLFAGKFYSCSNTHLTSREDCEDYGYTWVNSQIHFDNVAAALLTLFTLSTLEGWPDIMYMGIDSVEIDQAPKEDNNRWVALYFVIFIVLSSFFFMNLFTGVIFRNFCEAQFTEDASAMVLTKEQNFWLQIGKAAVTANPTLSHKPKPRGRFQQKLQRVVESEAFDMLIMIAIGLNMVVLAMDYNTAHAKYKSALENCNLFFTIFFIVECFVKLIGMTPQVYFATGWNRFDFFVVLSSLTDIILSKALGQSQKIMRVGPQLIRILRITRVTRLFRIIKSLKIIKKLIEVIAFSLPAVLNILTILMLNFLIFAVLGAYLFHTVDSGDVIDDYNNFHNFSQAFLMLIRISTGEEWNLVMYDCGKVVGMGSSVPYFLGFISLNCFVLVNLFMMVVLQEFQNYHFNPSSVLSVFSRELANFNEVWLVYSSHWKGLKMSFRQLVPFAIELGQEFGFPPSMPPKKVLRLISVMNIAVDNKGFVYFNDVLYAILKFKYLKPVKHQNPLRVAALQRQEVIQRRLLSKLRLKISKTEKSTENLWLTMLYLRITFSSWHNWANRGAFSCHPSRGHNSLAYETV